ncbi:MAG TPA: hypothetical protein VGJ21_19755 [Terracidiphilus sp.]|jgi:hypothetical protein
MPRPSTRDRLQGYCSIATLTGLLLPAAAIPTKLVGTPAIAAGTKETVPSRAELEVAD